MATSSAGSKPTNTVRREKMTKKTDKREAPTDSTSSVAGAESQPAPQKPIRLISGAKRQLKELTGYPIDSVSGFARDDDAWKLVVTVVELNRIPSSTDVMAEYIVTLDEGGDIVNYHRGRRYFRDQVGEAE